MKTLKWIGLAFLVLILASLPFIFEKDIPKEIVDEKYSSSASKFLITDKGARIHYRDHGIKASPTIVLVHGAMASLHTWEPWVEILSSKYRVVTLDLPGHGLTGKVPQNAFGPDNFTETINAVVNELGIDRFVLGGNSMGGGATWRYTLNHPDRVVAMILVASVGLSSWRKTDQQDRDRSTGDTPIGFYLLGQPWFRAVARYLDPELLVEQGLMAAYNNSPVVDQRLVDRYYELIMREGTREAILRRGGPPRARNQQEPDLSQLVQPTLVMWGAKDALVPVSIAEQFDKTLPNADVVIYPDLGHIPMEEDPLRTAKQVMVFLESLTF